MPILTMSELNPTQHSTTCCFSDKPVGAEQLADASWTRRLAWADFCTIVSGALPERPDDTQVAANKGGYRALNG
ncbi:hypothetical protein PG995_000464 [Apiospora arundinis]